MSKKDKNNNVEEPQLEATANAEQEQQVEERSVEEQLQDQVAAEKEKFMRLFAEFENYKKRTNKERMELFTTEVRVLLR